MAIRATTRSPGGTIFNKLTKCTAYADDVITGRNVSALKHSQNLQRNPESWA
jgi:hypothetical protein